MTVSLPATSRPADEAELLARARALAGRTVAWLAGRCAMRVPSDPRGSKGWVGLLLEQALGATAGGRGIPDFPQLGIELKSLPVDARGAPRESTWVCVAPTDGSLAADWARSRVRHKLARVLWVPVLVERDVPLADRRFGMPLMWSPTPAEEATLRADWEMLTELVRLGRVSEITAHRGEALQLRPKAANAADLEWSLAEDGTWARTTPRGFYLRSSFTAAILRRCYALPGG